MEKGKIIRDISTDTKLTYRDIVLTIGNFDGVHRGHLSLFRKVIERAESIKGISAVMTFDPHPLKILGDGVIPSLLTDTDEKMALIAEAGVELIFCLPFTKEFSSIRARDFVEDILVGKMGVKELVVGYDYNFGYKREGDIRLLKELGKRHGFKVHVVEPVKIDGLTVSSTLIRRYIRDGNVGAARKLLGRNYAIKGTIVKGRGRGKEVLNFPTANLLPKTELLPRQGVYAVEVMIGGKRWAGVTNIGTNPTFDDTSLSVETHILGFSKNILGEEMKIAFIERIRDEVKFTTPSELAYQISLDIDMAEEIFKKFNKD